MFEDDPRYRRSLETLIEVADGFELVDSLPDAESVANGPPARGRALLAASCARALKGGR